MDTGITAWVSADEIELLTAVVSRSVTEAEERALIAFTQPLLDVADAPSGKLDESLVGAAIEAGMRDDYDERRLGPSPIHWHSNAEHATPAGRRAWRPLRALSGGAAPTRLTRWRDNGHSEGRRHQSWNPGRESERTPPMQYVHCGMELLEATSTSGLYTHANFLQRCQGGPVGSVPYGHMGHPSMPCPPGTINPCAGYREGDCIHTQAVAAHV